MQEISVYEMRDAIALRDPSIAIVDVRTPTEFADGYIEGAINIPLDTIGNHIDKLRCYEKVYMYYRSGARSQRCCLVMSNLGLTNTYTLTGGILAWQKQMLNIFRKH